MKITPLFGYMLTLSVIQPARIQDIEESAPKLLGEASIRLVEDGTFRSVHSDAREYGWVIAVRKGVYVLSRDAAERLRSNPISNSIDNQRLFLIKATRKAIM